MPFDTEIPLSQPSYNIGETVYLRESASLGFLEAYTVKRPVYELDGTIRYELITGAKPPDAVQSIADRVTGQQVLPLTLPEVDLIPYCEALTLARDNLQAQLNNIEFLRTASGCPDVTG